VIHVGFLKKLNPFDNDDDKKKEEEERRAEEERQRAEQERLRAEEESRRAAEEESRRAAEAAAAAEAQRKAEEAAVATLTSEGKVEGAGMERTYTTKAGDRMEAIAAYFYGDPVHKQRLLDDNPALRAFDGRDLPAGLEIKVGEDPNRGDTVAAT
jgi:nucleoid-associated protein YgaU